VAYLSIGIVCGVVAFFSTAFLLGSTPDEEEFRFSILSAWLHVDALRHGGLAFWTSTLGFGVPQPFSPNLSFHPLLPLLAFLSPVTWVRVLLLGHTLLGAAGMWQLARRLGMRPLTTAVCVSTFLLATPAQNYVLTDFWLSHYIVWTSAPWLLLLAWRLLEAEGRALQIRALTFGLCAGLVAASANPGHLIVYVVVAAAVLTVHHREAAARGRWIALAALVAMAIACPMVAQLAHERPLFAPELPSWALPAPLPWTSALNTFAGPFGPRNPRLPFARMLFFGGPFAVLCLIGCVRFARRHADLVLVVAVSTVLLFTPLLPVPFVSARFHFRDPLILAAILLAGLAVERLLASGPSRRLAATALSAQLVIMCASAWPAMARTWVGDARRTEWFLSAVGATDPVEALLNVARPAGRLVLSPVVDEEIFEDARIQEGLGINALAYRGFPVVNGWFKGVSTASIWPDERLLYGRIRVPQELLESETTLDVLGIRYVLAHDEEPVAQDLVRRGVIPKYDGTDLVLYENPDRWPDAFVLPPEAERVPVASLPACANNRLLCTDLAPIAGLRSTDDLMIQEQNGRIDIELSPADAPRLLVVSQMFRPDWTASANDSGLATVRAFGGLIGVRVPAGVTSVQLRYRPIIVMLATWVAWGTLIACVAALVVPGALNRARAAGGRWPAGFREARS
jgi:hypothetical protein